MLRFWEELGKIGGKEKNFLGYSVFNISVGVITLGYIVDSQSPRDTTLKVNTPSSCAGDYANFFLNFFGNFWIFFSFTIGFMQKLVDHQGLQPINIKCNNHQFFQSLDQIFAIIFAHFLAFSRFFVAIFWVPEIVFYCGSFHLCKDTQQSNWFYCAVPFQNTQFSSCPGCALPQRVIQVPLSVEQKMTSGLHWCSIDHCNFGN